MFAFELWREFKLSIAEILAVFPNGNTVFCDENILVLNWIEKEEILKKANNLGGTIKIVEIINKNENLELLLSENLIPEWFEWKFSYAINIYWQKKQSLKELLKISKEIIKKSWFNPRFVNKDFKNISSTIIIKEALIKKQTDINIINVEDYFYIWRTIFVQNIYAYSNRDYWKETDMNIWMLPPKLSQIMINLWKKDKNIYSLYDPFVWLWTVLIEWAFMWINNLYWSDINWKMIETSTKNLENIKNKFDFKLNIFNQNAKYINEINFLSEIEQITTEWYLWEIMTKNNISLDRINKQKEKLLDLYSWFFSWLKKWNFKWNIVISFPFWDMRWKFLFFEEIYDIINKYCIIEKLIKDENISFGETKAWSLLYKRNSQIVWREIFSLILK